MSDTNQPTPPAKRPTPDVKRMGAVTISRNGYIEDLERQLAEAREQRDRLADEVRWLRRLVETIRDKADMRFNGHRGVLAFSDLKDAALASMEETP